MSITDSLKSIRDAVMQRLDWTPSPSPDGTDMIDRFINEALQQLALDAPFLFFENKVRFTTQPDVVSASTADQLSLVTDTDAAAVTIINPFVMSTVLPVGTVGAAVWQTDRSWDGRYIELADADGVVHVNRIRSVWTHRPTGSTDDLIRISLWHPWPHQSYGTSVSRWRVFTPEYPIPDDMIELRSMRVLGADTGRAIRVIGQDDAEEMGIDDSRRDSSAIGFPEVAFRRGHFAMPTPNTAPAVAASDGTVQSDRWLGPEPPGTFEYVFTLAWGKRDVDYSSPGVPFWATSGNNYVETETSTTPFKREWAQNRVREPMWESSPSPISDPIVVPAPSTSEAGQSSPGVYLTLPNIEYMLGFLLEGYSDTNVKFRRANVGHSGWHYRIYRRRTAETYGTYPTMGISYPGQSVTTLRKLDMQDAFFLLAEMRIDYLNAGAFIDQGTIIPDYNRRLRNINGYQHIRLHPNPTGRCEVEMRCLKRPDALVSDSDVPPVHPEAIEVLKEAAIAKAADPLKDRQRKIDAIAMYDRLLKTLRTRYGDLRSKTQPLTRRSARVTGMSSTNLNWYRRG